jgi:hypothetical protein
MVKFNKSYEGHYYPTLRFLHRAIRRSNTVPDNTVSKVTGYGLDDRGRILIFTTTSRSALGPIQWLPGTLSLGLKLPERETDDLIPSGAEFKNAWSFSLRSSSTLRSRWSQGDFYNFAAIVSTHDNVNVRLTAL